MNNFRNDIPKELKTQITTTSISKFLYIKLFQFYHLQLYGVVISTNHFNETFKLLTTSRKVSDALTLTCLLFLLCSSNCYASKHVEELSRFYLSFKLHLHWFSTPFLLAAPKLISKLEFHLLELCEVLQTKYALSNTGTSLSNTINLHSGSISFTRFLLFNITCEIFNTDLEYCKRKLLGELINFISHVHFVTRTRFQKLHWVVVL